MISSIIWGLTVAEHYLLFMKENEYVQLDALDWGTVSGLVHLMLSK
jgi:hypothetical protein